MNKLKAIANALRAWLTTARTAPGIWASKTKNSLWPWRQFIADRQEIEALKGAIVKAGDKDSLSGYWWGEYQKARRQTHAQIRAELETASSNYWKEYQRANDLEKKVEELTKTIEETQGWSVKLTKQNYDMQKDLCQMMWHNAELVREISSDRICKLKDEAK